MNKIRKIIIGTNNIGKYKEICNLLPKKIKKYSPRELSISSPIEIGKSFQENSKLKALYYSKKSNLVCISDDSGLEISLLNGAPGINSARWGGANNDFNLAIERVFKKLSKIKKNCKTNIRAKFVCCLTIYWPSGKNLFSTGIIEGKISQKKRGNNGFGYDPIFIPDGYNKTFGEMNPKTKMLIDHRSQAFLKIKKYFA